MTDRISDDDRKKLAVALAAAIGLIYAGKRREAHDRLGHEGPITVSQEQRDKLTAFAAERAQKVQNGVNSRIDSALADLPDDATADDEAMAVGSVHQGAIEHNARILAPFIAAWAAQQALADSYRDTPTTDGRSLLEAVQWVWTRNTDAQYDECQEAADASPASYDDLISIAGDEPPVHSHCLCTLTPA